MQKTKLWVKVKGEHTPHPTEQFAGSIQICCWLIWYSDPNPEESLRTYHLRQQYKKLACWQWLTYIACYLHFFLGSPDIVTHIREKCMFHYFYSHLQVNGRVKQATWAGSLLAPVPFLSSTFDYFDLAQSKVFVNKRNLPLPYRMLRYHVLRVYTIRK